MGTPYQDAHDQFSQMPPPDPNQFLKLIWGHLTPHQQDLFSALLNPPSQPAGAAGNMAAAVPAPAAAPATAPAAPVTPRPAGDIMGPVPTAFPSPQKTRGDDPSGPNPTAFPGPKPANTVKQDGLSDLMRNTGLSEKDALAKLGGATVEGRPGSKPEIF